MSKVTFIQMDSPDLGWKEVLMFEIPAGATESDARDCLRAVSEAAREVVDDWTVTVTGEHDDAS